MPVSCSIVVSWSRPLADASRGSAQSEGRVAGGPARSHAQKPSIFWSAAASLLLLVFLQLAICGVETNVQVPEPEYVSKADFLAKLPNFVKWPGAEASSLEVGILGDDPFGGALDKFKLRRSKRIEDLKGCQMVFIAKSEAANVPSILASLEGANVLTVGETEGFAREGGMIGFVLDNGKVRFELNTGSARRSGLGFDLRLLRLALHVFNS